MGEERSPMAGDGFLQSLWEKPIWKGIWPHLGPMDGVCLRTASVGWNVPGKYGPHGGLFFFLIQKEPASMPGKETVCLVFNVDIRTSSLLMSSRSVCLLPCASSRKKEEAGKMGVMLIQGMYVSWVFQRFQREKVRAKPGQKTSMSSSDSRKQSVQRSAACHWVVLACLMTRLCSWRIGSWQTWH